MEILNLKSTITEIKISLAGLNGKFKLTEKKIKKLRSVEMLQPKEQAEKEQLTDLRNMTPLCAPTYA